MLSDLAPWASALVAVLLALIASVVETRKQIARLWTETARQDERLKAAVEKHDDLHALVETLRKELGAAVESLRTEIRRAGRDPDSDRPNKR